jgi:hypothetical protein
MSARHALAGAVALVAACATTSGGRAVEGRPQVRVTHASERAARMTLRSPEVELFYRGEDAFARRGGEEWALGVKKAEMAFSPDKKRFCYTREKGGASDTQKAPRHVLVRNLAGDPVNEFIAYRPGVLDSLGWLDNRRIAYVTPAEAVEKGAPPLKYFVVHDAVSGEVLAARPGTEFTWGPEGGPGRHVVFVTGGGKRQQVVVDGRSVWPRSGTTRVRQMPVWSPDGRGLAFTEEGPRGARLVVLVEYLDAGGDLTWDIPRDALDPSLKVFWAGDSKVVIGPNAFDPKFAADWQRLE